ncbi:MAG: hypothetical protein H0X24_10430 [Ktedonobacterales bacterium]|nr:hypothetical protein [Ktedonobacterales bacterium]
MRWRERLTMYILFLAIIAMGSLALTLGVLSIWSLPAQAPGALFSGVFVVGMGILFPIAIRLLPMIRRFASTSPDVAPVAGLGPHLWLGWFVALSTCSPLLLLAGDPLHANRALLLGSGGMWSVSILLGYIFIPPRPDSTLHMRQFLLGARSWFGRVNEAIKISGAFLYDVTLGILCMVMIGASFALTVIDVLHLDRQAGIPLFLFGMFGITSFPVVHRVSRYMALWWEPGRVSGAEGWRLAVFVLVFLASFILLDIENKTVIDIPANVWHAGLSVAWIVACGLVLTLPARPMASRGGPAGADLYIEEDHP